MLQFSSERNTETLDSEPTMNARILELQAMYQDDPELLKKFQVKYREHLRAKQDNLPQDTPENLFKISKK